MTVIFIFRICILFWYSFYSRLYQQQHKVKRRNEENKFSLVATDWTTEVIMQHVMTGENGGNSLDINTVCVQFKVQSLQAV